MASNSNMLLDPIQELAQVLSMNTFGLAPSPTTQILLEASFPITDEDKVRVAEEQVRSGEIGERVRARANVGLLEGDVLEVVLDRRGYTLVSATSTTSKAYPSTTYESLEAMLIGVSPAYVEAMTKEITRRFEMEGGAVLADEESGATEAEVRDAEAGSEVWK